MISILTPSPGSEQGEQPVFKGTSATRHLPGHGEANVIPTWSGRQVGHACNPSLWEAETGES
jgi:hypothetical protein